MKIFKTTISLLGLLAIFWCPGAAFAGAYEEVIAAANDDRTATVVDLVQRGVDIDTADPSGTTLMMTAATNGNDELLDFLLVNHANPLKQNKYGDTALALAALYGRQSTVRRLLHWGVPVDGPGWTALHYAAFNGHHEIARYLIAWGAKVNAHAPNHDTALMLAARNGHQAIVRILLDAGADARVGDLRGNTAVELAEKAGNSEIANLIRAAGTSQ